MKRIRKQTRTRPGRPSILFFLAGAVLLPFCVAATRALLDTFRAVQVTGRIFSPETTWLLAGYGLWLLVWLVLPRPMRAYVIAHELTHALWALCFGARVRNLRVTAAGGSVTVSKSNLLITLAPYFFPFYTILVILLRLLLGAILGYVPWPPFWLFLVGLTWGFHICFTVQSLFTAQPDIQEYGRLFSYVVIYLFNLFGIGIWTVCTTAATFAGFWDTLLAHTLAAYAATYTVLQAGVLRVSAFFAARWR